MPPGQPYSVFSCDAKPFAFMSTILVDIPSFTKSDRELKGIVQEQYVHENQRNRHGSIITPKKSYYSICLSLVEARDLLSYLVLKTT